MTNYLKKHKVLLGILLLSLFLRLFRLEELLTYSHDQDLAGWFVRDVVENKHLRLIGQETSTAGIFIGALFYYMLIPFYLLFDMDPIGGAFLTAILGVFTVWSVYFVFKRVSDEKTGIIGAFIYAIGYYTVFNDREVVPTMPVLLWSVWYLMALDLLYKGKHEKGLLLLFFLVGLIWHLNFALVITLPLAILAYLGSKPKFNLKQFIRPFFVFLTISVPLSLFEVRHGFIQVKAFVAALTTDQNDIYSGFEKMERVYYLLSKNFSAVIWGDYFTIDYRVVFWMFFAVFAVLVVKKKMDRFLALILFLWVFLYWAFFSLYSKPVSEYYLNGSIAAFVYVVSRGLSTLFSNKKAKDIAIAFLVLFAIVNFDRVLIHKSNYNGYRERKALVNEIKRDSELHRFDCVSISYITDLGYDRGYRYFMWREGLKTKEISEKVPVYTIVFPLKDIFPSDKTFGGIGLINPDYERYDLSVVSSACGGEDFNKVNPMIGFTD